MATHSAAVEGAHGAEALAEEAATGLPQLDFTTFPSQIFWLAVATFVLFQLMNRVALPRIASVLEERADAIADPFLGIAFAEAMGIFAFLIAMLLMFAV